MQQFTYEQQDRLAERQISPKTFLIAISSIVGIIVIIIIMSVWINAVIKNNNCNDIEEKISTEAINYLADEQISLSVLEPTYVVSVDELYEKGYLYDTDITIDKNDCNGEVKITRVGDEYITTPYLTGCSYCSTDTRYSNWSEPTSKLPNKNIVDVIITYNYVEKEINYTSWTNYYTPAQLENAPFIDVDDSRFITISEDAKNVQIVQDDKNYYRYQDQKWKYYRFQNSDYSDFSSTQPSGYETKDTSTTIQTEWTDWSLNSPDKEDYRFIETKTGYRWYYEEDGNKIYYDGGTYLPTAPDDKYTETDKDDKATVFRYKDDMWRWYNGDKRVYSSYMSEPTESFPYLDSEITTMSSYSSWSEKSSLTSENESYRNEEIEVRSRFRLKYDMYSFNMLTDYVDAEDFEDESGFTLKEVYDSEELELIVSYEYIYKK